MKLLAIDTSGPVCGVAILTEAGIVHECATVNRLTHSANLLPMIDAALCSTGLTLADMDRFAVVTGPFSPVAPLTHVIAPTSTAAPSQKRLATT